MTDQLYTLELAKPEDLPEIDNYLSKNFFTDVPMFYIFGFDEWNPTSEDDEKLSLEEDLTFIVKAISAEGNIVGVAINRTKHPDSPITEDTDPRFVEIDKLIKFVEEDSKMFSLPDRTVGLYMLSVAPDWRQKGIAKKLSEESVRIAKERGFEVIKVISVNEFTSRTVQSLGFQEFYKMAFKDYSQKSGNEVSLREIPPHDYISIYIKYLNS